MQRRLFLRQAGVCLALPAFESLRAAPSRPPSRFVAINIPLGFYGPNFFPTGTGTNYQTSPYLEPADELRKSFTVVSGTSHPDVDGGHAAEKSFLTAAPHPGSRSFQNTLSLDQWIADRLGKETRHSSLTLGEHSLSWSSNGVSIPAESSPAKTFARLFLKGTASEIGQQKQRLAEGRSILDTVLEEARSMENRVSAMDRVKLDQYLTAVRETEAGLLKADRWIDTPKPAVATPPPAEIPSADVAGILRAHFQVLVLALRSDSTRVAALGGNGGSQVPPLKGVTMGYHGLSHHGKNPEMIHQLEIIDRATLAAWLEFLTALRDTPEEDGSLLDHTQVLLGSNLGNASGHITTNLPIILAGGPFRHGQHLAFGEKQNHPLGNLFVSILQGLGFEEERFASGTKALPGLERNG